MPCSCPAVLGGSRSPHRERRARPQGHRKIFIPPDKVTPFPQRFSYNLRTPVCTPPQAASSQIIHVLFLQRRPPDREAGGRPPAALALPTPPPAHTCGQSCPRWRTSQTPTMTSLNTRWSTPKTPTFLRPFFFNPGFSLFLENNSPVEKIQKQTF